MVQGPSFLFFADLKATTTSTEKRGCSLVSLDILHDYIARTEIVELFGETRHNFKNERRLSKWKQPDSRLSGGGCQS